MRLLLIDNYDSFVFTLADLFRVIGAEVDIYRHDAITANDALSGRYQGIILSPGPKGPAEAGVCTDVVKHAPSTLPILGICLGHQVIIEAFGGHIGRTQPVHGQTRRITHKADGILAGLPNPFDAALYHSLAADHACWPNDLIITATSEDDTIMATTHKTRPVTGLQFHPESFMSPGGAQIARNFFTVCSNF